ICIVRGQMMVIRHSNDKRVGEEVLFIEIGRVSVGEELFKKMRWKIDKNKIKAVFKLQFQATQLQSHMARWKEPHPVV
ncbi:hypothetical protein M8C21_008907, partial [Ambrosia artemisiifolia]